MTVTLNILLVLTLIYTGISTAYLLFFAIAGHLGKPFKYIPQSSFYQKIAVLIPAYKEDAVIVEVVRQSLVQSYPSRLYDIIVVPDSLRPETMQQLSILPIRIIPVQFENPTKAQALNAALKQLPPYDIALILDADNVMNFYFLEKISTAFAAGCIIVQGHRTAKNMNTSVAVLDAISEEINNHIFRKGHRAIHLSAALIGSAMAFEYTLFKELMQKIDTISGFDKELELALLQQGHTIQYLADAWVYDEKVQYTNDFRHQRTRWIAAQFNYLREYFFTGIYHLIFKGNIDFFNKVFQFLLLPRILLLGMVSILLPVTLVFQPFMLFTINILLLICLLFALLISVPKRLLKKISLKEVLNLPVLFVNFIGSVANIKQARKKFIHTPHGKIR